MKSTQERIIEAAQNLFSKKGIDRTSVKDIAQEAHVNIAALNYHFNSKENLIDIIFGKMLSLFFPALTNVFSEDVTLEIKIQKFIDAYINVLLKYNPQLPFFIMSALQREPERIVRLQVFKELYNPEAFYEHIRREVQAGNIAKIDPQHYFMTILSLIGFQFAMQNMLREVNQWEKDDFKVFVLQRKEMIYSVAIAILRGNVKHP